MRTITLLLALSLTSVPGIGHANGLSQARIPETSRLNQNKSNSNNRASKPKHRVKHRSNPNRRRRS
jgi:hypothetical protein